MIINILARRHRYQKSPFLSVHTNTAKFTSFSQISTIKDKFSVTVFTRYAWTPSQIEEKKNCFQKKKNIYVKTGPYANYGGNGEENVAKQNI